MTGLEKGDHRIQVIVY